MLVLRAGWHTWPYLVLLPFKSISCPTGDSRDSTFKSLPLAASIQIPSEAVAATATGRGRVTQLGGTRCPGCSNVPVLAFLPPPWDPRPAKKASLPARSSTPGQCGLPPESVYKSSAFMNQSLREELVNAGPRSPRMTGTSRNANHFIINNECSNHAGESGMYGSLAGQPAPRAARCLPRGGAGGGGG